MGETVVSVERVIEAPAASIFAIVADASRHAEIDGSGSVKGLKEDAPRQLALGTTFGMSMKLAVPYSMSSTVIEFEQDRRIAWQTIVSGPLGRFIGGRIWRYELEDADGGSGTLVRETWDISQERVKFAVRPARGKTRKGMEATLERIEQILTA